MERRLDLQIDELSDYKTIGTGGFSTVLSAWDEGFQRRVAVKVLHVLDEAGQRRFERERAIMGKLSYHQNVIMPFPGRVHGQWGSVSGHGAGGRWLVRWI